jgi:pimeloyl-ACP methyl ester carboxylesterase
MDHGMADGLGKALSAGFPRKGTGRRLPHSLVTDQERCVWGFAHRDCVRCVVSYIQEQRLENVILVGHGFGGSVIQKVAEEIPGLIKRTVFLDALIVEDGHCIFDELPAEYVALFNDLARVSSDNTMLIPWEVWRDNFIQDAPEAGARSLLGTAVP